MAKCVEELQVWQRARDLVREVFAATDRQEFRREAALAEQLSQSVDSVLVNISEGFGQSSDRAFARFLGIARGSANEVRAHLTVAVIRRCLSADASAVIQAHADEICRMLTGFERYLLRSDRKRRF